MSRQNYYKTRSQREQAKIDEDFVLSLVRNIRKLHPRMGGRKLLHQIRPQLEKAWLSLGRDRLFSLLRKHDLLVPHRPRRCCTTNSSHGFRTYGNLLRDEKIDRPGQAIVSDITYLRTREGWMYLALVMDVYSRTIVGYDCSDSLESEGALRALKMALRRLPSGEEETIHHSDRGIQYCSSAYIERLQSAGCRISMTEVNHCYENAKAERLNGILKQEYGLGDTLATKATALAAVREAVELYNTQRPHLSLDYRTPMEAYRQAT